MRVVPVAGRVTTRRGEVIVFIVVPVVAIWVLLIVSPGTALPIGTVLGAGGLFTALWPLLMWMRIDDHD